MAIFKYSKCCLYFNHTADIIRMDGIPRSLYNALGNHIQSRIEDLTQGVLLFMIGLLNIEIS
jgi:hypothetical protein